MLYLQRSALLMIQGVRFIMGSSVLQATRGAAEPYFTLQQIGPLPVGILLGLAGLRRKKISS